MDSDHTTTGTRSRDAATVDLSGRCVGTSYLLVRPIGHGATGTVWRAVDRGSGEQVAVKLLHESLLRQPKLVTRFVQERTILLMLRHRNVVRVRDLFSVGESLGLVMDLVAGGSLRGYLRERGTLPPAQAARFAAEVAAALTEAHALGIVHRDLKPDNILLQTDGGEPETRLTDFGIARVLSTPGLTTPHAVVGTPYYMAPEAFHGAPTEPAVDVYALGVLLYELVVGEPPYAEESIPELMRRHLEDRPERRDGLPDALWAVIAACMDHDARKRPTAAELAGTLDDVARKAAGVAALPPPEPRPDAPADWEPGVAPAPAPRRPESSGDHPSLPGSAQPPPQRRNQAPAYRWVRPGLFTLLVLVAMLGSGIAASTWQAGRAGTDRRTEALTVPAAPPAARPTPAGAAAIPTPVARVPAAARAGTGAAPAADRPVAAATTPAGSGVKAGRGGSGTPAGRPTAPRRPSGHTPEARPYGPYTCRTLVLFSSSSPMAAKPCHAVGSAIRATGRLAAPPGTRATVSLRLQNAATGRPVGGTRHCGTLVFTDESLTQSCGPVEFSAPHGQRYVVVQTWRLTREGKAAQGTAQGAEFTW